MRNKVLVVDDMKFNRQILADILQEDYTILEAENGELRVVAWNLTAPEAAAYLKGEAPLPEGTHT